MATILLQSAGAALGGALGGPFGALVGRAAGAIAGRAIDQQLFARDRVVQAPRLEEAQILASSDGAGLPRVYGRARIGGQVIWATRFEEVVSRSGQGGGKGAGPSVTVEDYAYFANFAVGICEGPVSMIGRIWADGSELDLTRYDIRCYPGGEDQSPDPLIEARQGADNAPAYRGTAYAVFEGFPLEEFGNRIPQLSFEIIRSVSRLDMAIRAVTIIPGATEFGYDPEPVIADEGPGRTSTVNRNNLVRDSDWRASIDELVALCPNLETVALVVAWFGDDLRAGNCTIRPGVEFNTAGGTGWTVSGVSRASAREVSRVDGKPAFGGTPSDHSVIAAIEDLKARGLKVVLYPFVMMDIPEANGLADPYGGTEQKPYPWRGSLACYPAPGQPGTADGAAAARDQILAFAGNAAPADFAVNGEGVTFAGGEDWGYRRMILHCAKLATAAGGVDGFLIGSEMRGLSTVRDDTGAFPFVDVLRGLATDVRAILGAGTRITYGADWSEYFGHHPQDGSGDVLFHLDALWSDPAIDAVGIDNYMPLADWRMSGDPGDSSVRSQFDPGYLLSNVAGGEGHDWYYATQADRQAGLRTPVTDSEGEPWIWRCKDILSWWQNPHHERAGGVRSPTPTPWLPESKPIWFTEIGCGAVNMGANQPNAFGDPKSGQSALPHFSTGARSDLAQNRFLMAHFDYWDMANPDLPAGRNPVSAVYGAPMVDPADICVWTWDARPFPRFPGDSALWSDGGNWHTGHWLNGRLGGCPVQDLCEAIAGDFGVPLSSVKADGFVDGYVVPGPAPARAALEPLLTLFNIGYVEEGEVRRLQGKAYAAAALVNAADLVEPKGEPLVSRSRDQESELPRQTDLQHSGIFSNFEPQRSHSRRLETASRRIVSMDLPLVLPGAAATGAMEARLRDAWIGRERLQISLPGRYLDLSAGDQLAFGDGTIAGNWRIESIEDGLARRLNLKAIAHFDETGAPAGQSETLAAAGTAYGAPQFFLLNLPLVPQATAPHLHVALAATPWARRYALYSSPDDSGFALRGVATRPAVIGNLLEPLASGPEGRWDEANRMRVELDSGQLAATPDMLVLNGANAAAVMTQSGEWEILQFAAATLEPDGSWTLERLLRGQLGTETAMASGSAAGSRFVLLDEAVARIDLTALENGLTLNWRAGPAADAVSEPTFTQVAHSHAPLAARPLSPVHLSASRNSSGDVEIRWVRRSRLDADNWDAPEIPLGEDAERYRIDMVRPDHTVARTFETTAPLVTYAAADQIADFGELPAGLSASVAQIASNGTPGAARQASFTF